MLRRAGLLTLGLLIVFSGTAALAQSEAEVERAAAEVEAAEAEAASAAVAHSTTTDSLLNAILTYETTTLDLEAAGFRLAAAQTAILEDERRLSDLRRSIEDMAAGLYMVGPDRGGFLNSADSIAVGLAIERAVADIETEMIAIDTLRGGLHQARDDADELRRALTRARSVQVGAIATINTVLDDVEVRQQVAADRRVVADAAYETAVTELEKARKGITPKVEAWGQLVASYFPEDQYWNALQVMACESRGTPTALNPISDAAGLFQFLPGTWLIASKGSGFEGADPYEPEANVASAAWLVQRSIDWEHP
ncbi:MAG: hypothetical protein KJN71_02675, partial [Acidimicrobiia bacterium]|nr:hypothetical protein [Acidimicrobiia bacterium]